MSSFIFDSEERRKAAADAAYAEQGDMPAVRRSKVLGDYEVDGVREWDAPDFCDAFICWAEWDDGTELTEEELDELNNDSSRVYDLVIAHIY